MKARLQEEVRDWVSLRREYPPQAILAALMGNIVALSRALGISREAFLQGAVDSWDTVETARNRREGRSS